jgi:anti-anti-sigma factor
MPTRDVHVISISGQLHDDRRAELADLLAQFAQSGQANAEVDLHKVTQFDVEALSFLVKLRRICASHSGVVTLINPSDVVRRALHRGLEPYFRIEDRHSVPGP